MQKSKPFRKRLTTNILKYCRCWTATTAIVIFCTIVYFSSKIHLENGLLTHLQSRSLKPDETCTFVILCGDGDADTVSEMRALLISAMLLSTCPLHFVLIADKSSAKRAAAFFKNEINSSRIPVTVDIWTVSIQSISAWALNLGIGIQMGTPFAQKKAQWLLAKLYVPILLKEFDNVIVIDSDMVFLEDPAKLWSNFNDGLSWTFKMPLKDLSSVSNICSCVVLIRVKRVIEGRIYPQKLRNALMRNGLEWYDQNANLYRPKHADQGVYFILRNTYPKLFVSLDQRYNIDHCHKFYGAFLGDHKYGRKQKVSLLHRNCGSSAFYKEFAEPFFRFFRLYQPHWFENNVQKLPIKVRINQFVLSSVTGTEE